MKEQHGPTQEQHDPREDGTPVRRFGNYDLVRRIDVGGMGEVYLARQRTAFGREVAVKIIRSDLVHDMMARRRFLREAEVNAHIKHEHILPLFEFGEEQGRLFMVTPYIAGGTLATRLQSGPLPLSEAYQLFTALVQAIAYIHKRGVIHRDLKPSNILLDQENDTGQIYVRLIDFGIASIQGLLANEPLTRAGNELGTMAYLAPERLSGVAAPSNDIYSLGIILYEMLTGHVPTESQVARFPRPLEYIIHRCIAPQPEARFATADELLRAFEQAYTELTNSNPSITASTPVVRTRSNPPISEQEQENDDHSDNDALPEPTIANHHSSQPITPSRATPVRSDKLMEQRSLPQEVPALPEEPQTPSFGSEDYGAPTTYIRPTALRAKRAATVLRGTPETPPKRSKRSFVGVISIFIVIVLLVLAGTFYFTFQAVIFTTADITVSPKLQTISNVFTLSAKSTVQSPDANSSSIPLNTLSPTNQTKSEKGQTTGKPLFCFINCPKAVSSDDVNNLAAKVKKDLVTELTQTIKTKLQSQNAIQIGDIQFVDTTGSYEPSIGTTSNTVSVTLTEQASVKYVNMSDAKSLATTLLQKQVTPPYQMVQTQSGQPVLISVDGNGTATIKVAAAGLERYQLSTAELQAMIGKIKGMKIRAAITYIGQQVGVDANNIHVTVSSGDTLPGDSKQITVKMVIQATLPALQLPQVPVSTTPVATPTTK